MLYRLHNAGFKAYLVGGSVRDLLLGREPKDFDIATDARPEQVRELFRNCRLIGRRFRLAHVRFGREIIEVATFRGTPVATTETATLSENGRILRDNVYGDIDEDVRRRDFTANALYYNIADFSVVDYVGGVDDIKASQLCLIGDPEKRFREDPVRMLRAVRFSVKLDFTIDPHTRAEIQRAGHLLDAISPARLFDEMLKLFHGGVAEQTFEALRRHKLLVHLLPLTEAAMCDSASDCDKQLIVQALKSTDKRIAAGKSVNPAFLLAAFLWPSLNMQVERLSAQDHELAEARLMAADAVISQQIARLSIPRRLTTATREIWALQARLLKRVPKGVARLTEHVRFRAAYDFLLLRAAAGEPIGEYAAWWTRYLEAPTSEHTALLDELPSGARRQRRRRKQTN